MKLIDNLYSINAREFDNMGDKAIFGISLNADNVIYKAHFPSNPITPGVCLIQMALEITELCKYRLRDKKTEERKIHFTAKSYTVTRY